jgi:hypothetical protein
MNRPSLVAVLAVVLGVILLSGCSAARPTRSSASNVRHPSTSAGGTLPPSQPPTTAGQLNGRQRSGQCYRDIDTVVAGWVRQWRSVRPDPADIAAFDQRVSRSLLPIARRCSLPRSVRQFRDTLDHLNQWAADDRWIGGSWDSVRRALQAVAQRYPGTTS